ncbi:MAG: tRNA preQ1(34) S-adenosylmethionine ribosyltransferase-isomerase QueA [Acidiferrobacterales bacterium]|nr:tRNA preQ1(34) S-adenosylmethionine ribosyltransferase-isomerase QueA [Acidiferrobacterales bacterium]
MGVSDGAGCANQFDFDLPADRIAQYPAASRSESRLLVVSDRQREIPFSQLEKVLQPGDLLVCNDSKVITARLEGRKTTGGRVEILIERIVDDHCVWAQMRSRRPCRIGTSIIVDDRFAFVVRGRIRDLFVLAVREGIEVAEVINSCGSVPLPPYIQRPAELDDASRYQTVYAKHAGSVAAPTAGLHFDQPLIERLHHVGIKTAFVTLHVGSGTFAPIRDDDMNRHTLHSERYRIAAATCEAIRTTRNAGGRVVAVGTTSMRVLETAAAIDSDIRPREGETSIFIKPGFDFRVVQALITNFHLPRSTLMMLVCAFGGTERLRSAYRYAIDNDFRFYSYGDAMFIEPA